MGWPGAGSASSHRILMGRIRAAKTARTLGAAPGAVNAGRGTAAAHRNTPAIDRIMRMRKVRKVDLENRQTALG
jgi:hypothetical protein